MNEVVEIAVVILVASSRRMSFLPPHHFHFEFHESYHSDSEYHRGCRSPGTNSVHWDQNLGTARVEDRLAALTAHFDSDSPWAVILHRLFSLWIRSPLSNVLQNCQF